MRPLWMCAAAAAIAVSGCEKHSVTDAASAPPPGETTETVAAPAALPVEPIDAPPRVDADTGPPKVDADIGPPQVDAPATTPTL